MLEYHEKITNSEVEEPHISDNRAYLGDVGVGEGYMQLAARYGLDDDMFIGNPSHNRQ